MRVVHVAHLESGALARQTARPEGRHAALVRQLGQRIGLVHELRQRVRAEERVDDAADRARVHQVLRRQVLAVAHVHPLADRARHARQADVELLRDLLADRAHAAVAEMVDVVHRALLLLQLDQVVDDRDDVLLGQRGRRHRDVEPELAVHPVASDVAEVVPLLVEEEPVDQGLGGLQIGRIAGAELLVDGGQGVLFGADDVLRRSSWR